VSAAVPGQTAWTGDDGHCSLGLTSTISMLFPSFVCVLACTTSCAALSLHEPLHASAVALSSPRYAALQRSPTGMSPATRARGMSPATRARGMLLAAGAAWGTYPVVLRALYAAPGPQLPPTFIVAVRFVSTTLIFALFQAGTRAWAGKDEFHGRALARPPGLGRAALELSLIGFAGNFMSVWGLSRVTASLAETLLGCVHIFVPILTVAFGGSSAVGRRTWQACALSFLAVCIAAGGSSAAASGGAAAMSGLAALVGAAALYSLARVRTQHHVGVQHHDALALNRRRMGNMGVLATTALLLDASCKPGPSRAIITSLSLVTRIQWILILTSCVASGFVGSSLQFQAQKVLPAASSQPFFALQPLFACGWTWLFLSEPIAPSMLTGGAMMVAGALLASTDVATIEGIA